MYVDPIKAGFVLMALAICALAGIVCQQAWQIARIHRSLKMRGRDKRGRFTKQRG